VKSLITKFRIWDQAFITKSIDDEEKRARTHPCFTPELKEHANFVDPTFTEVPDPSYKDSSTATIIFTWDSVGSKHSISSVLMIVSKAHEI
jgi:hypothetical protein